jgi:hypothetical protein
MQSTREDMRDGGRPAWSQKDTAPRTDRRQVPAIDRPPSSHWLLTQSLQCNFQCQLLLFCVTKGAFGLSATRRGCCTPARMDAWMYTSLSLSMRWDHGFPFPPDARFPFAKKTQVPRVVWCGEGRGGEGRLVDWENEWVMEWDSLFF